VTTAASCRFFEDGGRRSGIVLQPRSQKSASLPLPLLLLLLLLFILMLA